MTFLNISLVVLYIVPIMVLVASLSKRSATTDEETKADFWEWLKDSWIITGAIVFLAIYAFITLICNVKGMEVSFGLLSPTRVKVIIALIIAIALIGWQQNRSFINFIRAAGITIIVIQSLIECLTLFNPAWAPERIFQVGEKAALSMLEESIYKEETEKKHDLTLEKAIEISKDPKASLEDKKKAKKVIKEWMNRNQPPQSTPQYRVLPRLLTGWRIDRNGNIVADIKAGESATYPFHLEGGESTPLIILPCKYHFRFRFDHLQTIMVEENGRMPVVVHPEQHYDMEIINGIDRKMKFTALKGGADITFKVWAN